MKRSVLQSGAMGSGGAQRIAIRGTGERRGAQRIAIWGDGGREVLERCDCQSGGEGELHGGGTDEAAVDRVHVTVLRNRENLSHD